MGWIDRHRQCGVVLALIALALQMVIAFDHVHLRGLAQHASDATAHRTVAHARPQTPAPVPVENDDYCAICASIFLASSAFAPPPPPLLVPANFERVEHGFDAARPLAKTLRLAFRSRAPPVA
jgi:hypothetical protein